MKTRFVLACALSVILSGSLVNAQNRWPVTDYFRIETAKIASSGLDDITSGEEWTKNAPEFRRQLREMLGLDPWPERTPLNPVITGTIDHEDFTVENVHFQSLPGVYVTGNLYVPKKLSEKAPAILYACGHGRTIKGGVSYGNKVNYQHHGAWFAQHGYVCLLIDTIQLGEIQGMHHGTYRHGEWWWNSRGYTPAGVEAWNCVRAIDYLQNRPEVDGERIGMTGRSGGGVYTWWTSAIDERVKVAAPVAGITDLQNYVVDGAVEGHCDCMFMVNTYRWDYDQIASLVAPRPLLIANTDKDTIFPLDGVVRVYNETRRIYSLIDAEPNIGLLITEGPHKDTQDLRVPVLRWFDRFLMNVDRPIELAAKKYFEPEQLKVFGELPVNERVTTIQKSFVEAVNSSGKISDESARKRLLESVFLGWPEKGGALNEKLLFSSRVGDVAMNVIEFESQPGLWLKLFTVQPFRSEIESIEMHVPEQSDWDSLQEKYGRLFGAHMGGTTLANREITENVRESLESLKNEKKAVAVFLPRDLGAHRQDMTERQATQWRRRYMLLGQTVDGMRVWDVQRAIQLIPHIRGWDKKSIQVHARGGMAMNALLASPFVDDSVEFEFHDLPVGFETAPDYLNIAKVLSWEQLMGLVE